MGIVGIVWVTVGIVLDAVVIVYGTVGAEWGLWGLRGICGGGVWCGDCRVL